MSPNFVPDRSALIAFCRKWHVRELSLFGSALREDFGPESDLDFLVSFEPGTSLDIDNLLDMKEELEAQF
ncbi:MAG: nucleotidyltransferase domain-containing protein, partial [Candidatus Hydrogenedentes bacterium]|nr:nucleotidyltransferase domain-containing protein [Candidatus Hydrogenedentota bacterium]